MEFQILGILGIPNSWEFLEFLEFGIPRENSSRQASTELLEFLEFQIPRNSPAFQIPGNSWNSLAKKIQRSSTFLQQLLSNWHCTTPVMFSQSGTAPPCQLPRYLQHMHQALTVQSPASAALAPHSQPFASGLPLSSIRNFLHIHPAPPPCHRISSAADM